MNTKDLTSAAKGYLSIKLSEYVNPSAQKVEKAKQKVEMAKEQLREAEEKLKAVQEEWHSFKEEALEKIHKNESTIIRFKSKLKRVKGDMRDRYMHDIEDLSEKNLELKKRIGRFKNHTGVKWSKFKETVKHSANDISHAWKDLVSSALE